jgi:hypothetical protein
LPSSHSETRFHGRELDIQVSPPEILSPAIVVAPDHDHRHLPPKSAEGRRHGKAFAGDDPAIGEPEIEEVSIYQQTIAQFRGVVKKFQQSLFDGWIGDTEMSVRKDEELLA